MEKVVKVGMMPGRINEFVVEVGVTIGEVLNMAELNPSGYDVKVDGVKIETLDTPCNRKHKPYLACKASKGQQR